MLDKSIRTDFVPVHSDLFFLQESSEGKACWFYCTENPNDLNGNLLLKQGKIKWGNE